MFDVRADAAEMRKLKRIRRRHPNSVEMSLAEDAGLEVPVVMYHDAQEGTLKEFVRGRERVRTFVRYGYHRIIRNCPHRLGKCIGERCAHYWVQKHTGDCVQIWHAELLWARRGA